MHVTSAIAFAAAIALPLAAAAQEAKPPAPKADGYRGIWYAVGKSNDEYAYKYSGGLGTYTANHVPIAIYSPEAEKTFFVYGGAGEARPSQLLIMAAYFDHKTGKVPKPTIITLKEGTNDAHRNPALSIDDRGYLWVFAASHGGKDAFIFRSREPYSTDAFDQVLQKEFSYPQPLYCAGVGHVFLFTKYTAGRELYVSTSLDGAEWTPDRKYAGFGGHYQVSGAFRNKRGTSFMWHPPVGGLDARTNLYYLESSDYGETWTNAAGKALEMPLSDPKNGAMVRDYQAEGYLVYINDLNFDRDGRPVILYVLSRGHESGPKNGPRIWTTARWTGSEWDFRTVTTSDHNYDMGSLYIEEDGAWRIIGPTAPGPQAYGTGGEVVLWTSADQGKSWTQVRQVTRDSRYNHAYVRRPLNAHPDFYAFWADGDPFAPSPSRLCFTNKAGDKVWVLPEKMSADFEAPRLVAK